MSSDQQRLAELQASIEKVFVGKSDVVQKSLITFLAGGHLLIEDVPGVGKTTLALTLARAAGCSYQRLQFTSDLLPSDILGVSILSPRTQEFEFKKGPIFHQVVLADELNRATPRTQSALLEAMNERQVTVDGQTYALPRPFFVLGTQNPHEHHGAFPLPESQLDRFMMRLSIGYPDLASEKTILIDHTDPNAGNAIKALFSSDEILALMDASLKVSAAPVVDDYILSIVRGTREHPRIEIGVSPRGALALRRASQARALLAGRNYVTPDDVKALAVAVLAHRLLLPATDLSEPRRHAERLVQDLVDATPVPL